MSGRRPNSYQARICVLGFRVNTVGLVSRFFNIYLINGLRCSAIGRTLIRQGSVSQGLVLIGCGQLVISFKFLHNLPSGFNTHFCSIFIFCVISSASLELRNLSGFRPCTQRRGISAVIAPSNFIYLSLNWSDMALFVHYIRALSMHYFQAKSRIIWQSHMIQVQPENYARLSDESS